MVVQLFGEAEASSGVMLDVRDEPWWWVEMPSLLGMIVKMSVNIIAAIYQSLSLCVVLDSLAGLGKMAFVTRSLRLWRQRSMGKFRKLAAVAMPVTVHLSSLRRDLRA